MKKIEAQAGLAASIPTRLAAPEQYNPPATRPVVDVKTIASQAANEIVGLLAEHQEQQKKAGKSFLKRRQPKPEVDLVTVAESIREAVEEAYRVSAAACVPPVDLTEEHMAEIAALQEQAVEMFAKDILRAADGDQALLEQVYELCPSLKPAPEPDTKQLAELQRQADRIFVEAMQAHEKLIDVLVEMDNLTREEAAALAGSNQVGNGRIRRQAEHVKAELIRLLERQEICRQIKIPAARW